MKIRYGCNIALQVQASTPVVCTIDVHPDASVIRLPPPVFELAPGCAYSLGIDAFGNAIRRFVAAPGETRLRLEGVAEVSGDVEERAFAEAPPVQEMPSGLLTYLNSSRYCDSDNVGGVAWQMFGQARRDTALVEAICDYTHRRIKFGYAHARGNRTASEAHAEQVGVCRDFAHLAIALCRALNIPARYANGYMGDIGVPPDPAPMDFNAWFEAYLGGKWYTFDPRHNCRRIGRLVIARGRDACDIPILQTYGPHVLAKFEVVTEETIAGAASTPEALAA